MSMVAFFPWFRVSQLLDLGRFELVPWERGREPSGPSTQVPDAALQRILDAVFSPFYFLGDVPVESATLLRLASHPITMDLSPEEPEEAVFYAQLVSFSGLAEREFFTPYEMEYCNSDCFRLIVQSFGDRPAGTAISVRRRDGATLAGVSEGAYREYAPLQVQAHKKLALDLGVLTGLIAAMSHDEWPSFEEAIFWFNQANTDAESTPEHAELVMTVGAFERLFDLRSGKEVDLVQSFTRTLVPQQEQTVDAAERIPKNRFDAAMSIREAWIRDLFRLRSGPAHGRRNARYQSVWPLKEHLLLGALAFPLTLKLRLNALGFYQLSERDHFRIDLFERLACQHPFEHLRQPMTKRSQPAWRRLREEHTLDRAVASAIEAAKKQR